MAANNRSLTRQVARERMEKTELREQVRKLSDQLNTARVDLTSRRAQQTAPADAYYLEMETILSQLEPAVARLNALLSQMRRANQQFRSGDEANLRVEPPRKSTIRSAQMLSEPLARRSLLAASENISPTEKNQVASDRECEVGEATAEVNEEEEEEPVSSEEGLSPIVELEEGLTPSPKPGKQDQESATAAAGSTRCRSSIFVNVNADLRRGIVSRNAAKPPPAQQRSGSSPPDIADTVTSKEDAPEDISPHLPPRRAAPRQSRRQTFVFQPDEDEDEEDKPADRTFTLPPAEDEVDDPEAFPVAPAPTIPRTPLAKAQPSHSDGSTGPKNIMGLRRRSGTSPNIPIRPMPEARRAIYKPLAPPHLSTSNSPKVPIKASPMATKIPAVPKTKTAASPIPQVASSSRVELSPSLSPKPKPKVRTKPMAAKKHPQARSRPPKTEEPPEEQPPTTGKRALRSASREPTPDEGAASGRPRRSCAPTRLAEPALNKKMRRN